MLIKNTSPFVFLSHMAARGSVSPCAFDVQLALLHTKRVMTLRFITMTTQNDKRRRRTRRSTCEPGFRYVVVHLSPCAVTWPGRENAKDVMKAKRRFAARTLPLSSLVAIVGEGDPRPGKVQQQQLFLGR